MVRQQLKLVLAVGSVAATLTALDMSTWFIWPHGGLPARMAVLGFAFAAFPLAAGFAILRRGLYGIDVVINWTLVYGVGDRHARRRIRRDRVAPGYGTRPRLTVADRGRDARCRDCVPSVRARVQGAVDRRFNRARYDALHRMTGFLDDLRAGRAAPGGRRSVAA